jgi:cytochrome oxidase assembly protein ShyY1
LTLDEGPHRSYAFQWFSFATIAIVGGIILFLKQGRASA